MLYFIMQNSVKKGKRMKFSINQSALYNMLTTVNKAVSPRSLNPALSGVLIDAQENEVSFRATDLELSIQASGPALIEEDGKALLPAKLLTDICSTLPDEAVNIEVSEEKAEITCANSNFNIRTLNATDYPEFPKVETNEKVTLPFKELSQMIRKVARMTARDDSTPIMQGVNINVAGNNIELTAMDGYRFCVANSTIETDSTNDFSAVISGAFLLDIASLKGDIDKTTISLSENQVVVECNDIVFINRRIAGTFPNYKSVMPQNQTVKAKINIKQFAEVVRRISVLSVNSQVLTMKFDPSASNINLSGSAADVGSCDESINASFEEGTDEFQVLFNCNYVLDGLSCFDCDEIIFEAETNTKPGIFKDEKGEITYALGPIDPK